MIYTRARLCKFYFYSFIDRQNFRVFCSTLYPNGLEFPLPLREHLFLYFLIKPVKTSIKIASFLCCVPSACIAMAFRTEPFISSHNDASLLSV